MSIAELDRDVSAARARLADAGVRRGACVGLLGENCYEWVTYDLALLALGCVSVCFPVDEYRGKSVDDLAERYDLSLLLVTRKASEGTDRPWVLVMNAAESSNARARTPTANGLRARLSGTDVCTVIFSSGTSGKLKALLLSKEGVEANVRALADVWQLGPRDRILIALPLSIFQQRLMIYAALMKGANIALTDSANLFRGYKVLQPTIVVGPPLLFEGLEKRFWALPTLERRALSVLSKAVSILPARAARSWLRRRLFRKIHETFGGSVRVLITGSAPSKRSTLDFFEVSGLPLFQAYGLAEAGWIAWNTPTQNRPMSVGRVVFPNSVSIATDGEIIIAMRRPQAVGYFGVDATEERLTFTPDGRVRTGDLGHLDADGYLHITGRKKDIIITQGGQKVHPAPLELELALTPGVARAVIIGGGELPGLVAVVAIHPESTPAQEAQIQAAVDVAIEQLNARVVPASRIVRSLMTRVPFQPDNGLVTRNLKVDRNAVYRHFERALMQPNSAAAEATTS